MARTAAVTRPVLVALASAIVGAAFLVVRPASTPGPALRDFEAYYAAGAAWHYGGDPYGRAVWRAEKEIPGVIAGRDEMLPFVGPPFGLPLWSAISRLPWHVAVRVWQSVLALSLLTIALGSLRLAGGVIGVIGVIDAFAVLVVAAGFGPLTSGLALGQVAIVSTAAVVLAALALRRRGRGGLPRPAIMVSAHDHGGGYSGSRQRRIGFGFVAALIAALQPNLAIVLVALLGSARSWIALIGAALVAFGGSAVALAGPFGFARYLDTLRAQGAAESFIAIQTTPGAVARALGASAQSAGFIAVGCAVVAIAGVGLLWGGGRYAPISRLALACAALPLALPFAHEHDFVIVFLPAILTVRRARGRFWVLGAVGALLAGTDWLGLAQRPEAAAQTMLLTLAAALALATLARGPLRIEHALPALLAFGVLGSSLLAAGHRLPIWPDALGAHFHVPAAMPLAAIWHLEQVRSGIARLDPRWGALRLCSLLGCVLLWVAASRALAEPEGKAV